MRVTKKPFSSQSSLDATDVEYVVRHGAGSVAIGFRIGGDDRGYGVNVFIDQDDLISMLYKTQHEKKIAEAALARYRKAKELG
jgi:hypothetical protein